MTQDELQDLIYATGDNFTVSELWGISTNGDPKQLDYDFMAAYFEWRLWHGISTMVLSAYRPTDPNAHGKGLAIDSVLWDKWKEQPTHPMEQWLKATTYPFWGVGLYLQWGYKGRRVCGIHTDMQQDEDRPLRWIQIKKKALGDDRIRKYYYYQDTVKGRFYNSELSEALTLEQAIKTYWEN